MPASRKGSKGGRSNGRAASTTPAPNGRRAGSMVAQAQFAQEELERLRYLQERAEGKQEASGHDADRPYMAAADDGPVLSYAEYLQFIEDYETALRRRISPGAMELAERRLEAQDASIT